MPALAPMLALLTGCTAVPGLLTGPAGSIGQVKPGELIVTWREGAEAAAEDQVLAAQGLTRLSDASRKRQRLVGPAGQELALARRLRDEPLVAGAEPNYVVRTQELPGSFKPWRHPLFLPNDPAYIDPQGRPQGGPLATQSATWGLRAINAEKAWDVTAGAANVIVAVIDTGVDMHHPDLEANIDTAHALNLVEPGQPVDDDFGHGTHVCGIIAAVGNNGIGGLGVAWRARVMPIRVLGVDGTGSTYDTIDAIEHAVSSGARVINMSLGSPDRSDAEESAISEAIAAGVVVVAAAGNEATDGNYPEYPATYPGVVGVAAVGPDRKRALFSNFNSGVTVSAPGVDILSTIPTRMVNDPKFALGYLSGTSMATPMVSGAAALVIAAHPSWTPAQVVDDLKKTALRLAPDGDVVDFNVFYGYGLIDCGKALGRP